MELTFLKFEHTYSCEYHKITVDVDGKKLIYKMKVNVFYNDGGVSRKEVVGVECLTQKEAYRINLEYRVKIIEAIKQKLIQ